MTIESPAAEAAALPLFYKDPVPLAASKHGDWRLLHGDMRFAADTAFVPILAAEIAAASCSYPVVFTSGGGSPIAVVGLEHSNLFVADGQWDVDAYVPAYVRRYPFGFIATTNPDGYQLAIDAASELVAREGKTGVALFEEWAPTARTQQALDFCAAFGRDANLTMEFVQALRSKELLIDRRADATLPDGRQFGVSGFQIVDAEKFEALDEATVLAWHRNGLLGLISFHLASLERFHALMARQARRLATDTTIETANGRPKAVKPKD